MHVHLLAGGAFTLAALLWICALLAAVVHGSGRRSIDYLLVAVIAALMGGYATGIGMTFLHAPSSPASWALGAGLQRVAGVAAIAACLHLAIRYDRIKREQLWAIVAYSGAAIVSVFMVRGSWTDPSRMHFERVVLLGIETMQGWVQPNVAAIAYFVVAPLAAFLACALYGRAYLNARREALMLFVGAGVLGLTVTNDTLIGLNVIRGLQVMPLGFLAFLFAIAVAFVSRYSLMRGELGRRATELRARAQSLEEARQELRAIQSELGRTQQLAAIGEMAAVIAHEVRNPLAVISNAVASLRRNGLSRHDHDVLLGILDEEAERLNRLVSDLLAYARPVSVQRQRVVLHDVVQRAALLAANRANARFAYDETNIKGQIWGDANLLRQVFDNIVENAVQAMNGVGTVSVGIRSTSADGVEGVAVSIRDEGEGMDTQVRSRAKDPFFTTRPAGTGLGLAIVNRIVEAHGGHLDIQSRSGEGTNVTVFLPIGAESLPPPEIHTVDAEPPRALLQSVPPAMDKGLF